MELKSLVNLCDIFEVDRVWDLKTLHAVNMTPLLEMSFVSSSTPIRSTSTDLTLEFYAETMKFVEPKWYRLAIVTYRKWLWVKILLGLFVIRIWSFHFKTCHRIIRFDFVVGSTLLFAYLVLTVSDHVWQEFFKPHNSKLQVSNAFKFFNFALTILLFASSLNHFARLVDQLNMLFTFQVRLKHVVISEWLLADLTVQLWLGLTPIIYLRKDSFPWEKWPVCPLLLKGFLNLEFVGFVID